MMASIATVSEVVRKQPLTSIEVGPGKVQYLSGPFHFRVRMWDHDQQVSQVSDQHRARY